MRRQILLVILVLISINLVSAETFKFEGPSDKLEINEEFGDVAPILDSTELSLLQGLTINTNEGSTSTKQYIRFGNAATTLTSPKINYIKSDGNEVNSFIYITGGASSTDAFVEYELEFENAFESSIIEKSLDDYEDAKVKIFADTYTILDANIDTSTSKVKLLLSTSAASNFIKEGETVLYKLDTNQYEVTVQTISNSPNAVILSVNGKSLGTLEENEIYELSDGTIIGVRRIIKSSGSAPDLASIFIGAQTIEFEDKYNDATFEKGYSVNKEKISDGEVSIIGTVSSDVFSMTSLKFRILVPKEIYIGPNERLSDKLIDKEVLLGNWDIINNKFDTVSEINIDIKAKDNSNYDFYFENQDNKKYKFPFYTAAGTLGDATRAFRIVEGSNTSNFVISLQDYFILSTGNEKNDKSYILQYNNIDTTNKKIFFNEMLDGSTNQITATYSSSTVLGAQGEGVITIGGNEFNFYLENATTTKLAVDQNKDGDVSSDQIDLIIRGGAIIDLGTTNSPGTTYTLRLTTKASSFEESSTDEAITFDITGGTEVGITSTSFTNMILYSDTDQMTGMSDYGAEYILTNLNLEKPEELEINYPTSQRFANVNIELLEGLGGSTTSTSLREGTCSDGIQNGDEAGIDCGGSCHVCGIDLCANNILDSGEEGIDCGGSCSINCIETSDQSKNQNNNLGSSTSDSQCPFGCDYIDEEDQLICMKINEVIGKLLCESLNNLVEQRENGVACKKDISCISGACKNSVCASKYGIIPLALNIILIFLAIFIFLKVHTTVKE